MARQAVLVVALVVLAGCSASTHEGAFLADSAHSPSALRPSPASRARGHSRSTQAARDPLGPIDSALMDADFFQGLLVRSGVPPQALPQDGHRLTPEDAARLLSWLVTAEVPLRDFGPWRMAAFLLWEVVQDGSPVPREALYARMRRFQGLLHPPHGDLHGQRGSGGWGSARGRPRQVVAEDGRDV